MPSSLIYEVECELDPDIVADYDAWLPGHVRDVLACQGFLGASIQALETPAGQRQRRRIQYQLEGAAALDHYLENKATQLRTETAERFGGRVHCTRRVFTPRVELLPAALEPSRCLNCGAPVAGRHCAACGQAGDIHVLSMREVAGDITHSLLHLDSRVWRTLKLLVLKPGVLTREFIAGRHQSYLPPFRLYLAISLLFFALSTLLPDTGPTRASDKGETVIAPAGEPGADVRKELAQAGVDPATIELMTSGEQGGCKLSINVPLLGWLQEPARRACERIKADGGARLFEHFADTAPKLMFVFLPLMAAVALLFYWRPRRLYAEHLVLFLHSHAFMFVLLAAISILNAIAAVASPLLGPLKLINFLLFAYLPYYVFRSMRVVYSEGRLKTAAKFTALATIYFVLLAITMLSGLIYTALTLS